MGPSEGDDPVRDQASRGAGSAAAKRSLIGEQDRRMNGLGRVAFAWG